MIRSFVLGAATLSALTFASGSALAADLPPAEPAPTVAVPSFSWTGPYFGVQSGYAWQRASNMKPNGWMLGGYLGVNYQIGEGAGTIVGLETDLNYADIDGKRGNVAGGRTRVSQDWNGATRARLGFAFNRFLAYGAAGIAYGDRELKRSPGGKDSKTAVGWTVGGGVEVAATENVALRAEYRYTDYGKDKLNLGRFTTKSSATEHRVMGGVAFKFDSPF